MRKKETTIDLKAKKSIMAIVRERSQAVRTWKKNKMGDTRDKLAPIYKSS